jgi:hypothetical protein
MIAIFTMIMVEAWVGFARGHYYNSQNPLFNKLALSK